MPLTRSKSMPNLALSQKDPHKSTISNRVTLPHTVLSATTEKLYQLVIQRCLEHYGEQPRIPQVDSTVSLVRGQNTFLLAGTGFGKSRVVELFLLLFAKARKPIVLILNPLDALGDNQVADKIKHGFTAINLTQSVLTEDVVDRIMDGEYHFLYLSPEIFLNSPLFLKLYFNKEFQRRVILKVVDEAHLIYTWGLVASGVARRSASWLKTQDVGIFRPSYGSLCGRLMATNHAPVLLMSATCRPKAIEAICKNLRWRRKIDVTEIRAELVRYEIRFIRLKLKYTLENALDLHRFYPPASYVPDSQLPRTLIYSGTQNLTSNTIKSVNAARKRTRDTNIGRSLCARRFHADTGPEDKEERGEDFVGGDCANLCCTMALGLGQNWSIVQRVIVMGRADPSTICQMLGRCGRDGRAGLGFMLMEPTRRGGKSQIQDFKCDGEMSDDDRMDALAITPVCLRVAFALDNQLGYIPLHFDDKEYVKEYDRQNKVAPCLCSNCRPDLVLDLVDAQQHITQESFVDIATSTVISATPRVTPPRPQPTFRLCNLTCPPRDKARANPALKSLQSLLLQRFEQLYIKLFPRDDHFIDMESMLSDQQAWVIAKNSDIISKTSSIRQVLGSEACDGQFDCIWDTVRAWKISDNHQANIQKQYSANAKMRLEAAQRKADKKFNKKAELDALEAAEFSEKIPCHYYSHQILLSDLPSQSDPELDSHVDSNRPPKRGTCEPPLHNQPVSRRRLNGMEELSSSTGPSLPPSLPNKEDSRDIQQDRQQYSNNIHATSLNRYQDEENNDQYDIQLKNIQIQNASLGRQQEQELLTQHHQSNNIQTIDTTSLDRHRENQYDEYHPRENYNGFQINQPLDRHQESRNYVTNQPHECYEEFQMNASLDTHQENQYFPTYQPQGNRNTFQTNDLLDIRQEKAIFTCHQHQDHSFPIHRHQDKENIQFKHSSKTLSREQDNANNDHVQHHTSLDRHRVKACNQIEPQSKTHQYSHRIALNTHQEIETAPCFQNNLNSIQRSYQIPSLSSQSTGISHLSAQVHAVPQVQRKQTKVYNFHSKRSQE